MSDRRNRKDDVRDLWASWKNKINRKGNKGPCNDELINDGKLIIPEFAEWCLNYTRGHEDNPVSFKIICEINSNSNELPQISIFLIPVNIIVDEDQIGIAEAKRIEARHPIVLVNERLDDLSSKTFASLGSTSCPYAGLTPEQILTLMVHFHILVTDYNRSRSGVRTLRDVFTEPSTEKRMEPIFSMDSLLNTWMRYGVTRAKAFLGGHYGSPERENALSIFPPKWGYIDIYQITTEKSEIDEAGDLVLVPSILWAIGDLPRYYTTLFETHPTEFPNMFKMDGNRWILRFDGHSKFFLNNSKGLFYIHHLLRNPGQRISCSSLKRYSDPISAEVQVQPFRSGNRSRYVDEPSIDANPNFQEMIDDKTVRNIRNEIKRLSDLKEVHEESEDIQGAQTVQDEINILKEILRNDKAFQGRRRKFNDQEQKDIWAVTKAIKRTIGIVQEKDKKMGEHLTKQITTGNHCLYAPISDNFSWSLF